MGIDTSMFPLYLNLAFFGMLGLGILLGFLRGLRKSLYSLIVKLIFYVIFFATLGVMSRYLWTAEWSFIGDALTLAMSELSGTNSLSEALPIALETLLQDRLDADLTNPEFVAFAEGVGLFAVKVIYAILYFTVIQLIYRFITWILYLVFFKPKKEDVEVHGKKRLAGMGVGFASGALAVYVTLILLGGIMNIAENFAVLAEGLENDGDLTASSEDYDVDDDPVQRLASRDETMPLQTSTSELDPALDDLNNLVSAYNQNVVVDTMTRIELTNDSNKETPLNLHLFDMIFSFEYSDDDIAFRNELAVFTDAASLFLASEYQETNNLSDVKGSDVEAIFESLSNSELLTRLTPLAIEMGAEHYDVDLEQERDEIYAIDYQSELAQLGNVFGVAFDMLNNADAFEDDADYDTISLEGDDAKTIFEGLGDSDLANLGAYVAMEPLIERYASDSGAVLTVPEDIVWEDEFDAFGEVSKEVLDTNITLGDIRSGDMMTYLQRLSSMDLPVVLDSRIIEQALINVFSGEAEVEGADMMVVNDDVQWTDETDEDGEITRKGELRIVLEALDAFAKNEDVDAIESFDQNVLLDISEDTLDAFLESEVLSDTLGDFMVNLETDAIVTPPSALRTITVDESDRDVVTSDEIKKLFLAVKTIGIDDFETVDFSADLLKELEDEEASNTLDQDKADTVFDSSILHATVSQTLFDLTESGDDVLVVPSNDIDDNTIRESDPDDSAIEYISTDELNAVLEAVIILDLSDLENFETLEPNTLIGEMDALLNSAIFHATIVEQLETVGEDALMIPDETADGTEIRIQDAQFNAGSETYAYINKDEIKALTRAIDEIGITNFDTMDFDPNDVFDTDYDVLLDSASIQLSLSDMILQNAEADQSSANATDLIVPSSSPDTFRQSVPVDGTDTEQIEINELEALLEAFDTLGLSDFDEPLDAATISDMGDDELDTILDSGSAHVTIDNMIDSNEDLDIPERAEMDPDPDYGTGITTTTEIKNFVNAVNAVAGSGDDITSVSFDLQTIEDLDQGEEETIADSMITRNTLTSDIEEAYTVTGEGSIPDSYYHDDDPDTFLDYDGFLQALDDIENA